MSNSTKTSKVATAAYIKEGAESLNPSVNDLFDKIINLRFIRKRTGRSFTIRSDYEPVFNSDGTVRFRKCVQKPDIKVSYKQVAESAAIEVDIYVTNLNVGDERDDKGNNISVEIAESDPVYKCIVQMGYRKQFKDWTNPGKNDTLEMFYDLADDNAQRGKQIEVQILTGYSQGYPPDKVMYFKGIIGNMITGLPWKQKPGLLEKNYGDKEFPNIRSEVERVLYQFITRRFISSDVTCKWDDGAVYIYKKNQYDKTSYEERLKLSRRMSLANAEMTKEDNWQMLKTPDGLMSTDDANTFGVVCAVSQVLRDLTENTLNTYGLNGSKTWSIPATPYNGLYKTLGGQIASIQQHYPFLRYFVLMNGSYYFYHASENEEDLRKDPYIVANQEVRSIVLPAIYDMTPAGTRTIRCPFVSFIGPTTTVFFQSRFTVGTFVGYYYAPKTNAFLVIMSNVSFATVQKDNMMELMCVDVQYKHVQLNAQTGEVEIKEDNTKHKDKSKAPEPTQQQSLRNMELAWREHELTVARGDNWQRIVSWVLALKRRPEGREVTVKTALEKLKEWNSTKFTSWMSRGNSVENSVGGIGNETGILVPWLNIGDKVAIREPFQDEYPLDQKEV